MFYIKFKKIRRRRRVGPLPPLIFSQRSCTAPLIFSTTLFFSFFSRRQSAPTAALGVMIKTRKLSLVSFVRDHDCVIIYLVKEGGERGRSLCFQTTVHSDS